MGLTVRGTQSPWMATLGDMTRERAHCFKLNQRVESIGVSVYCESEEHKSVDCDKIKGVADRRR